ncbi:uroporphyrinogen-III synthase [Pelagibacterium lacus]|uniref:Uroporphyrinogen-III synthase n=1 Tax=Pelagibacterium lacus TaxID=2282655 RepID=A0A369W8U2_9HYPH|nr:uroporphyrinogen-III synthase [Pelagibacterium lacus]RDE09682.1 uroporphyrinogen-III synthase [Pelagibacterium lacus]
MTLTPRRVLVTRPRADAGRTAAGLAAIGLEPVIAPLLEAQMTGIALPPAQDYAAVAATSANGVRALAEHKDGDGFTHLPLFAVGEHTANAARAAGFSRILFAQGTLAHLVELIAANRPSGPIFYPAAQHQSGDLTGLLAQREIAVTPRILYAMRAVEALPPDLADRLAAGEIEGAVFFSRRTATIFAGLLAGERFAATRRALSCLCLAENVAEPLVDSHFLRIGLADAPSHAAMLVLALAFARDQISP